MSHGRICIATSTSKTPIPQYNLSVKVVPKIAPDAISDVLKKNFLGGMPPHPPRSPCAITHGFPACPPYIPKTILLTPLQHFNEGLKKIYHYYRLGQLLANVLKHNFK